MSNLNNKLEESLWTGFIDKGIPSYLDFQPQLLINDKNESKKVLSTIIKELESCEEFWFSVAFITTSGVAALIETFSKLESKGIKGKLLVSQYLNFTQPEALRKMLRFKNIELKIVTESPFHSKGYLFKKGDYYDLIIGSSNLTATALCTNIEWNLKVTAKPNSSIIFHTIKEFKQEFNRGTKVTEKYILEYEKIFQNIKNLNAQIISISEKNNFVNITPNLIQKEALLNLESLRNAGKKKALLISATGTGKTYLSAFDIKNVNAKRILFVVHRLNIAKKALDSYRTIFGRTRTYGIFSGNKKDCESDYIFTTIQTISKAENLELFEKNNFDYIVLDETHRAAAPTYKKILEYFKPGFLLGMTATPERTDGLDIFKIFEYNIAYEIRLQKALEEKILSPFHYYGISEISINGKLLDEFCDFNKLISEQRVQHIINKSKFYGTDNGVIKGLIFCSTNKESKGLSEKLNLKGFKTISLSAENSEDEREDAILKLENSELDYILTVDIFNEGIDIPSVNQILLLRPTQSAIIFVQQLGRGLRKNQDKEYLTVIDFIGSYKNNFLVPIALFGDTSYNKDKLRKLMTSGSSLIPGESTINFDQIAKSRIFEAIDSVNLQTKKDLLHDFKMLKLKIGRLPMMIDFINHGSRDPFQFVLYSKSYYNFILEVEEDVPILSSESIKLLELFAIEINNTKRIEESIILKILLENGTISIEKLRDKIYSTISAEISVETIESCINCLNFKFINERKNGRQISVNKLYGFNLINISNGKISFENLFKSHLSNSTFKEYLYDNTDYSIIEFQKYFKVAKYNGGFQLYRKYSRKDVFRILNWESNPIAQNVGGYLLDKTNGKFPIFVTYHKKENISKSINFDDGFIDNGTFKWESKGKRSLKSPEIEALLEYNNNIRIPLFIQKNNDEGIEFYYMGELTPIKESIRQSYIDADLIKKISVVKVNFKIEPLVEDEIFNYLTSSYANKEISNNDIIPVYGENKPFKILENDRVEKYINCIPLYNFCPAAGAFRIENNEYEIEWVSLIEPFKYSDQYFICKVVGESMNKVISSNSWCLFKKDPGGTKNGKIVLVRQSSIFEDDFYGGYTVKQYQSIKKEADLVPYNDKIILSSKSTIEGFNDIVLTEDDLFDFEVIGIFVKELKILD
jgi:superfamily II DNA or RNA helicase